MRKLKVKRWIWLPLLVTIPPGVSNGLPAQTGSTAAEPASAVFTQKPSTPEDLGDELAVH